jgi:ribose transport system permease protein
MRAKVSMVFKKLQINKYIVYIGFLFVAAVFSVILRNRGFLSFGNIMNILRQTAMISIAAVGMTYVISAGMIDLSTGSVVALSALVTAIMLAVSHPALAVTAGLCVGFLCGLVNGAVTAFVRIPPFLVTLGTSTIFAGLARTITNLEAVSITNKTFNFLFGAGDIGPISTLFLWTLIAVLIGQVVYKKTSFGRSTLSVGGSETAARYSGIKVDRIKIAVMSICGLTAAFSGILYAGRLHGARYTLGENDNMSVIAAVVIGGTSFTGGKGTVFGTLIGSLVIGMLNNGLLLMGLSVSEQMIARGVIIILAVSLSLRQSK